LKNCNLDAKKKKICCSRCAKVCLRPMTEALVTLRCDDWPEVSKEANGTWDVVLETFPNAGDVLQSCLQRQIDLLPSVQRSTSEFYRLLTWFTWFQLLSVPWKPLILHLMNFAHFLARSVASLLESGTIKRTKFADLNFISKYHPSLFC
jgi:hypothetical protein